MATSSARPDDLDAYVNATIDQQPRVTKAAGDLKAALDTFRGSVGRAEFVDDVPEVDLDLRFFARRWDGLADWLHEVSQAFRDAGGDRLTTLDDSALNAIVGLYDPPEAEVVLDGDRVIIDAGAGNDDVRVTPLGDGRVLVIVNGEEHILEGDAARDITVRGNAGDDSIDAGGLLGSGLLMPGALTLDGGVGSDTIRGRRGNQTIRGDRGDDELWGDDELYGGPDGGGDDTILGGDGNDTIHGGAGNDTIRSGDGNDTIRSGDGDDIIDSGDDHDTIDGGTGDDTIDAGAGNNTVRGGDGNDTITTGTGTDRVEGGSGHDLIDSGAGDDTILGGDDNDTIDAGDGRDYVDGGRGIDVIDGGIGDDVIYGGNDNDFIEGGAGDDYIDGGAGDDRLSGGADDDIISGGEGDDTIFGDDGNDTVYTGPGDDFSLGGEGDDHMFVEAGDTTYASDPGDQVTEVTIDMDLVDSIDIDGSDEFKERVRADLVTLASSPTGQRMLEELRDAGLTIVDDPPREGAVGSYSSDGLPQWVPFTSDEVRYDVDAMASGGGPRPPIATLFHELAHAYNDHTDSYADGFYLGPNQDQVPDQVTFDDDGDGVIDRTVVIDTDGDGVVTADELDRDNDGDIDDDDLDLDGDGDADSDDGWTPNRERQAVGLPIDHDQNPDTPDVPASSIENHPDELTENALRREMGWPERTRY